MNTREITLEEVLEQRDRRQELISEMINTYPDTTIISFKLNIPGPLKNSENYLFAFEQGLELLSDYSLIHDLRESITGPESLLTSKESVEETKLRMIEIEDNFKLGRLYDLDVIGISRSDLNQPPRRCLICNEEAHSCSRSRKHGLDIVLSTINTMIEDYKNDK